MPIIQNVLWSGSYGTSGDGAQNWNNGGASSNNLASLSQSGPLSKLDTGLAQIELSGASGGAADVETAAAGSSTASSVVIDAIAADGKGATLLSQLEGIGLQHGSFYGGDVSGELSTSQIGALAQLPDLGHAYEDEVQFGSAPPIPNQPAKALAASDVLKQYDGAGVKVGILSDSFNVAGGSDTMQTDIANGYLPTDTTILQEGPSGRGKDEGRAMAQIVHELAPGASIEFASAMYGQAAFANSILQMAADGAKVIVDDAISPGDPYYQEGVIAQAVNKVASEGVVYLSCAHNDASQGYQTQFNSGGTFTYYDETFTAQNFATGGSDLQNSLLPISTASGSLFGELTLQWDQPAASASPGNGPTGNLGLFITDANGNVLRAAVTNQIGGNPFQGMSLSGLTGACYVEVGLQQGTTAPTNIKLINITNNYDLTHLAIFGDQASNTNSGTLFGHAAAEGAIAVGAVYYQNTPAYGVSTPVNEGYSSSGPDTLYMDAAGNRLPTPLSQHVSISATDGVDTSFFTGWYPDVSAADSDSDGFPNFFGTSAAAPSAAAIVADLLQANPNLTPTQVRSILEQSAIPTVSASGSPDPSIGGAGLIQADAALQLAENTPPPCYCRGTLIATSRGKVAVEDLQVGDLVLTASGGVRPIRWIGHRKLRLDRHPRPEAVRPVRIAAGTLADGVPARDLCVSPEHALWLDRALVAAKDLVNGATIRQEEWREVEYFHVELDSFDILLAEGAAAESYLDCGSRKSFDNTPGGEVALHADWTPLVDPRRFSSCAATARLRARLADRAAEFGRGAELAAYAAAQTLRGRAPRVNMVRNPRGNGAAVGLIGAGGAAPRHWWCETPLGVALEIVGQGVEAGLPFVDVRFSGRAQASGNCAIHPEPGPAIPAACGQDWAFSCYLRQVAGGFAGVEALNLYFDEYGANGDYLDGEGRAQRLPTDDGLALQRVAATRRIRTAAARRMTAYVQAVIKEGARVNLTLRVAGFQIEQGAYASDLLLPTEGALGPTRREGSIPMMARAA